MNILTFNFQDELVQELEKLQIQIDGQQNIIAFMISNKMNQSESFNDYEQDYFKNLQLYNNKKQQFQLKFINPILVEKNIDINKAFWQLNFNTGITTIEYEN